MLKRNAGPGEPGFRDRSRRLILFGALSMVVGAACAGLGLLSLLLPFLREVLPDTAAPPVDPRSAVQGFLTYALAAAVLIWAGVGSLRRRRWVRPVMLTIAWTWLFVGAFGLLGAWVLLEDLPYLAARGAAAWPPGLLRAVQAVVLGVTAGAGLLLPALFLWAYGDAHVLRTCERHDPEPSWTDRCPWPVLLLSLELGLAAALTLFQALRPVVPLFGVLVTGWKGLPLILCGAAVVGYLAVATYRRSMVAWWATTVLLAGGGLSVAVTSWVVDPVRLCAELGYGVPTGPADASSAAFVRDVGMWGSLALTLLSVIYMLLIRRHFLPAARSRRKLDQT